MMWQPDYSPWGAVQYCEPLCPGAYSVSTASHGGVMVQRELAMKALSVEARKCGFMDGGYLCFEEDCDAPVALRELMDHRLYAAPVNQYFGLGEYDKVINDSLQRWHKDYWQAREKRILQKEH